jgi:GT2 family glycosyltransferase
MKIVFCIPGKTFSDKFLKCWTNLIKHLSDINIEWDLVSRYSPIVHQVRSLSVNDAINKDYDYVMWIDSDIIFTPVDFEKLLSHDVDIVSGLYLVKSGDDIQQLESNYACIGMNDKKIKKWEIDRYIEVGENTPIQYNFNTDGPSGLIEVKGNGMGWMLIKKGVFEKIDNPFDSKISIHEDLSFQVKALEKGFKSYIDPSIKVGHEKSLILR